MNTDKNLELSLVLFRLATVAFLLVWVFQKLLVPAGAQGVFKTFYFSELPVVLISAFGVAQLLIVLAFGLGFLRFWSYGAVIIMHAVSTLSTIPRLMDPFTKPNALFWAAVPVLAGLVGLFLMRDRDRLFSIDARRGR
ncbi:MAG: DoxX protein [Chitinophagales bacterium]|nr:DoxX protein [Hyphomicrobiales bacterium]